MTPYEKNVEIWKQLWRVIEKSDIMVQIVDGRHPLFYRCEDFEQYAKEIDASKINLMLINKADLVDESVRNLWSKWFIKNNVQHLKEHLNTSNINVYQSDWFSNVEPQKKFDVIVSNPPYIDPTDELLKQGDVRFEPLSALISDDHGYADIKRIIEQSRNYLNVHGQLYLEHGFEQHQGVQTLLQHFNFEQITTFNDYGGNPRITMGVLT